MNDPAFPDAPLTEHYWTDFDALRDEYRRNGVVSLPLVDADVARAWAEAAFDGALHGMWPRSEGDFQGEQKFGTDGGRFASWSIDRTMIDWHFRELVGLYHAVRLITEAITGRPVVLSPHYDSSITIKVYAPGDLLHWHVDSNPISALLILKGDTPKMHNPRTDVHYPPRPADGSLLVFAGRLIPHGVAAQTAWKATVPFNLYHPEDLWRPAGMDGLIYGDEQHG